MKLLLTISLISLSFPTLFTGKFPGYIMYKDGTKKEVTFILPGSEETGPNFYKILKSVKYIDKKTKTILVADMCEGFSFYHNNQEYSFVSTPFKDLFLRTRIKGPVTLYYYLHMQSDGNNNSWPADDWILKNEYGEYLKVTFGGAKRSDLAHLFRDYEEFAKKILNKEINGADIKNTEKMVKIYNDWKIKKLESESFK